MSQAPIPVIPDILDYSCHTRAALLRERSDFNDRRDDIPGMSFSEMLAEQLERENAGPPDKKERDYDSREDADRTLAMSRSRATEDDSRDPTVPEDVVVSQAGGSAGTAAAGHDEGDPGPVTGNDDSGSTAHMSGESDSTGKSEELSNGDSSEETSAKTPASTQGSDACGDGDSKGQSDAKASLDGGRAAAADASDQGAGTSESEKTLKTADSTDKVVSSEAYGPKESVSVDVDSQSEAEKTGNEDLEAENRNTVDSVQYGSGYTGDNDVKVQSGRDIEEAEGNDGKHLSSENPGTVDMAADNSDDAENSADAERSDNQIPLEEPGEFGHIQQFREAHQEQGTHGGQKTEEKSESGTPESGKDLKSGRDVESGRKLAAKDQESRDVRSEKSEMDAMAPRNSGTEAATRLAEAGTWRDRIRNIRSSRTSGNAASSGSDADAKAAISKKDLAMEGKDSEGHELSLEQMKKGIFGEYTKNTDLSKLYGESGVNSAFRSDTGKSSEEFQGLDIRWTPGEQRSAAVPGQMSDASGNKSEQDNSGGNAGWTGMNVPDIGRAPGGLQAGWAPAFDARAYEAWQELSARVKTGGRASGTIQLNLYPESLGKVVVNLEMRDGAVDARFSAASQESAESLRASVNALRQSLQNMGVELARTDIVVPEGYEDQRKKDRGNQGGNRKRSGGTESLELSGSDGFEEVLERDMNTGKTINISA